VTPRELLLVCNNARLWLTSLQHLQYLIIINLPLISISQSKTRTALSLQPASNLGSFDAEIFCRTRAKVHTECHMCSNREAMTLELGDSMKSHILGLLKRLSRADKLSRVLRHHNETLKFIECLSEIGSVYRGTHHIFSYNS
jgi:hypothetical protein